MPCASVRTVAPRVALDAVFTVVAALEAAEELGGELEAALFADPGLL
jgi:hypothetical protein